MLKKSTLEQAMVYILVMIFGFPIVAHYTNQWGKFFGILMAVLGMLVLVFGLILFLKKWESRDKPNYRLLPFYIDIFIFYSLAYTFAVVASPHGAFIEGLHPIIENGFTYQTTNILAVYENIPHLFLDSIYYSVVTMTTLGDGSIHPKGIMKMVVISHVGLTFFITVFGIAEYFSNQASEELKKELHAVKLKINKNSSPNIYPNEPKQPKVKSLSSRIYISIKGIFTGRYV